MKVLCADCWQAYERLANGASGVLADPHASTWRERVAACGCAERNRAEQERHAAGIAAQVAEACPECGAPAGEWCYRHGVTQAGLLLMCAARRRAAAARAVES